MGTGTSCRDTMPQQSKYSSVWTPIVGWGGRGLANRALRSLVDAGLRGMDTRGVSFGEGTKIACPKGTVVPRRVTSAKTTGPSTGITREVEDLVLARMADDVVRRNSINGTGDTGADHRTGDLQKAQIFGQTTSVTKSFLV